MAAALVVLVVAVLVPVLVLRSGGGEGDRTTASEEVEANLDDVQVYEDLRTDHVDEDVDYETVPPVGGPHAAEWLDCGRYDEPVRDENAVHDLEHGAVWITYDPDLDEDDVAALEALLPQNGILSPYDGLPSPVVVTVWERQLALEGPDDPRLPLFLTEFAGGVTAPEPFASCAGGLTDGSGGTGKAV